MERRIPWTVWVAAACIGVVAAVQAALALLLVRGGELGWGQFAFAATMALLILFGLLRGQRLAWLWGRYLSFVLAILVSARSALAIVRGETTPGLALAVLGGMALPLFIAAILLLRPSAVAYFELVCPACRKPAGTSADILFQHARCRACGNLW